MLTPWGPSSAIAELVSFMKKKIAYMRRNGGICTLMQRMIVVYFTFHDLCKSIFKHSLSERLVKKV